MNNRNAVVNLQPGSTIPVIRLSQYDVGVPLRFVVYDGETPATFENGTTVTIVATRPSGTGFSETCTINGNVVSISTVLSMTQEHGTMQAELRFVKGSSNVGTGNIQYIVEQAAHPDGTIDADVNQWTAIAQQVHADTIQATNSASIAGAAGTRATEAANNAEHDANIAVKSAQSASFYAEKAASSETAASGYATQASDAATTAQNLLSQFTEDISTNTSDIATINGDIQSINADISDIKDDFDSLETRVAANESGISVNAHDIDDIRSELETIGNKNDFQDNAISEIQDSIESLNEKDASHDRSIADHTMMIGNAEEDIDELQENVAELTRMLNGTDVRVSNNVTAITKNALDISNLNAKQTLIDSVVNNNTAQINSIREFAESMNNVLGLKIGYIEYGDDNMVYCYAEEGGELICSFGPIVSGSGSGGGGGGGSSTNNAEIDAKNTTGWITRTISTGDTCFITFEWSSIEDDTPTGDGSVVVFVNGATRVTRGVPQGEISINVSPYLTSGRNSVRVAVHDIYDNVRYINYTINAVALTVKSSFDGSIIYTNPFLYPYMLTGDVEKTAYVEVDGIVIGTETTSLSDRQLTMQIPAQTHGTHVIRCWCTALINGETVVSNVLRHEFIYSVSGDTTPIIVSNYNEDTVEQWTNVAIRYRVYDPTNLTAEITLKVNGETINTLNVDRTEQLWSYRADTPGSLTLSITCGITTRTFELTVTESTADIEAVTEGLELFLTSLGRSNGEPNPAIWSYGSINAMMTGFNFVSNGWIADSDGNVALRINGGASVTIPLKIFERDFRSTGKTIEFEFATRYVRNYDTPIITCMDSGRGVEITSQKATLKSEQVEVSMQFKEDEHVRIAFVVEKRSENRLVYIYVNGIMSGVVQYPDADDFSQINPVNIMIGSAYSTVDIYNIRVYNTNLNRQQILGNWIADTQNVNDMLDRHARNNILDNYGNIVISKLPDFLPYMIINTKGTHLPDYKGDKVTVSGQYVNPKNQSLSYTFADAQLDVQGTSSQYYARKNFKAKYKKGVVVNGTPAAMYAMTPNGIPANVFCFKKDVASSEGANNVELVRLYDEAIRSVYLTPAQVDNPKVREGIDGYPMVIFEDNGDTTKFVGKYNHNFDKGAENVFGFVSGDESWEVKNNTSLRVLYKSADFSGSEWLDDFEARYPDTDPPYENNAQLAEFGAFVTSTDTTAATGNTLAQPATYNGVRYTADTAEYRLAKFKAEIGNYVEINSMLFYYLFTELFLMVDSRAKNMFPSFIGSEAV